MHRVNTNSIWCELDRCRFGRHSYSAFSRVVAHMHKTLAHNPGNRRNIHDRTRAGLLHLRDDRLHPQKNTSGIHIHLFVPGLGIE